MSAENIREAEPLREIPFEEDLLKLLRYTGEKYMTLPAGEKPNQEEVYIICNRLSVLLDQEETKKEYSERFLVEVRNLILIAELSADFSDNGWSPEYAKKQRDSLTQIVRNICESLFGNPDFPETMPLDDMLEEAKQAFNADTEHPTDPTLTVQRRFAEQWRGQHLIIIDTEGEQKMQQGVDLTLEEEQRVRQKQEQEIQLYRSIYEHLKNKTREMALQWGISPEIYDSLKLEIKFDFESGDGKYAGISFYDSEKNILTIRLGFLRYKTFPEAMVFLAHEGLPGHALDSLIKSVCIKKGLMKPEQKYDYMLGSPDTLLLEGIALTLAKEWKASDTKDLSVSIEQAQVVEIAVRPLHRLRYEMVKAYIKEGEEGLEKVKEMFEAFFEKSMLDFQINDFKKKLETQDVFYLFYHALYYLGIEKSRSVGYSSQKMREILYSSSSNQV